MNSKQDLIADLRTAYEAWESFLEARNEKDIAALRVSSEWTIKDVLAHLMAWQQISIARLQAALQESELELPAWLGGADPFYAEDHTREFNARIREIYVSQSWPSVYGAWRDGFLKFLELSDAMPEEKLHDTSRYSWMQGYALSVVLQGSCEHHQEHLRISSKAIGSNS